MAEKFQSVTYSFGELDVDHDNYRKSYNLDIPKNLVSLLIYLTIFFEKSMLVPPPPQKSITGIQPSKFPRKFKRITQSTTIFTANKLRGRFHMVYPIHDNLPKFIIKIHNDNFLLITGNRKNQIIRIRG